MDISIDEIRRMIPRTKGHVIAAFSDLDIKLDRYGYSYTQQDRRIILDGLVAELNRMEHEKEAKKQAKKAEMERRKALEK